MDPTSDEADAHTPSPWYPRERPGSEPDLALDLLHAAFRGLTATARALPPSLGACLDEVLERMAERSSGPERVLLSPMGTPAYPMLAWLAESLGGDGLSDEDVERAAEAMLLTYLAVRCQDDLVDESWADPAWTYLAETLMARALQLSCDVSGDPTALLAIWARQVTEFSDAATRDARWRADPATVWDAEAIHLQGAKFLPMAGPLAALLVRTGRSDRIPDLERTVVRLGVGLQLANDLFGAAGDLENGLHNVFLGRLDLIPGQHDPSAVDAALCRGMADERLARYFAMIVAGYRSSVEPLAALGRLRTPLLRDEGLEVADPVNRWMGIAGLDLVFPLMVAENVIGLMGCAAPPGKELFAREDVALLSSVAASLALSLSHSLAFETIQRMNVDLERRVEERTEELEHTRLQLYQWEKMASLGVLAAGVAHELNTPLGVVLSCADQLVEDQDSGRAHPARSKRLAQLCLGGAKRAADIVQNLRAFSRPESQDLQLVDVHELIDGTLSLLGPRLESQGISVQQQRGAILPLEGYPVLLNQTLTNLILNAANAVGENGEIRITTEFRDQERVAVIVEDDGPGIPEELSGRIYEPFFTTRPPGEGSGLGLSLCYTIVDQHGGKIWEEGQPGEGARFVVELPLRASEQSRRRSLSGEPSR